MHHFGAAVRWGFAVAGIRRCSASLQMSPDSVRPDVRYLRFASSNEQRLDSFRHRVARQVFRFNQTWAAAFVVQSAAMRAALTATFPEVAGRVRVLGQPVPEWLRPYRGCRERRLSSNDARLQLFYPSANYPYKNHSLLRRLGPEEAATWPVSSMMFTVPPDANPNPRIAWIECTGLLHSDEVIRRYLSADALVFLSLTESFGSRWSKRCGWACRLFVRISPMLALCAGTVRFTLSRMTFTRWKGR